MGHALANRFYLIDFSFLLLLSAAGKYSFLQVLAFVGLLSS